MQAQLRNPGSNQQYEVGIDWRFVNSIDVGMMKETQDVNTMQDMVNSFMASQLNKTDRNILTNPLAFRLVSILQVIIKYMFDCQDQLKHKVHELEDDVSFYKHKIKLMQKAQDESSELLRDAYHDFEKCPVCGKKFKAMRYVDRHMESVHKMHLYAWKSLRVDRPIDPKSKVKALEDEIAMLREAMNEQTRKFTQSLVNFNKQLDNQKNFEEQRQTVKPSIEYVEFPGRDCPSLSTKKMNKKTNDHVFTQSILHIEAQSDDENENENVEQAAKRIIKRSNQTAQEIHLGLGANYVTPDQVHQILQVNNPNYQELNDQVRKQIEEDFPLPKPKTTKVFGRNRRSDSSSFSTSSKKVSTYSESTPAPNVSQHETTAAHEEEETFNSDFVLSQNSRRSSRSKSSTKSTSTLNSNYSTSFD